MLSPVLAVKYDVSHQSGIYGTVIYRCLSDALLQTCSRIVILPFLGIYLFCDIIELVCQWIIANDPVYFFWSYTFLFTFKWTAINPRELEAQFVRASLPGMCLASGLWFEYRFDHNLLSVNITPRTVSVRSILTLSIYPHRSLTHGNRPVTILVKKNGNRLYFNIITSTFCKVISI